MTKLNFLFFLRDRLRELPPEEAEERLNFYSEMIEDRMEEGLSEEEAVAAAGDIDRIAAQILGEPRVSKAEPAPQTRDPGRILLLILASPLLLAGASVVFSLWISLWAVIVSFWAVFASLAACALGCTLAGIGIAISGQGIPGMALAGTGLLCAGLAIFSFCGCLAATRGAAFLTGKLGLWIKNCFVRKEESQCVTERG